MALSLKQVEKRKKNLNQTKKTKKASPQIAEEKPLTRPWKYEDDKTEIFAATTPLSEAEEPHNTIPKFTELLDLAQRNSYALSQITKKLNWWQQIQLYPKLKIPVPSIFHQRDEDKKA
ncbi:MAG: hypothetical protein H6625_00930 [Bdellovibrionaceae bacterium]|nr:hypothetical protein [Pseudobdellovibrionaceae bacterium]